MILIDRKQDIVPIRLGNPGRRRADSKAFAKSHRPKSSSPRLHATKTESTTERTSAHVTPQVFSTLYRERSASLQFAKRLFDLFIGTLCLTLLSPVFLIIALLIKLQSPGPVFYASPRVGRHGAIFICYKFRTMVVDAEAMKAKLSHLNERSGVLFKIARDPRVTPLGRLLRKYSLDELPQLFNVMEGNMSIVGPRPSIESEVAQYQPDELARLAVHPGITGLWQVMARQEPSFERYISLDLQYVREWSLWLDTKVLFRTVNVVLGGTGT